MPVTGQAKFAVLGVSDSKASIDITHIRGFDHHNVKGIRNVNCRHPKAELKVEDQRIIIGENHNEQVLLVEGSIFVGRMTFYPDTNRIVVHAVSAEADYEQLAATITPVKAEPRVIVIAETEDAPAEGEAVKAEGPKPKQKIEDLRTTARLQALKTVTVRRTKPRLIGPSTLAAAS